VRHYSAREHFDVLESVFQAEIKSFLPSGFQRPELQRELQIAGNFPNCF
jgi:hypothetical protein